MQGNGKAPSDGCPARSRSRPISPICIFYPVMRVTSQGESKGCPCEMSLLDERAEIASTPAARRPVKGRLDRRLGARREVE